MNKRMESFCNGYTKAIRLFPNPEEGIHTDWERIGKDIEISLQRYKKEWDSTTCQIEQKKILKKQRKKKISK